jgi:hypothetical protein
VHFSYRDLSDLLESNVGRRELLNHFVKISDEFQNFAFAVRFVRFQVRPEESIFRIRFGRNLRKN